MPARSPLAWLGLAWLLVPAWASAQTAPPAAQRSQVYSSYEQETIREALAKLDAEIEPHPEGKIIDHIEILTLEVVEDRDIPNVVPDMFPDVGAVRPLELVRPRSPIPHVINLFHTTSRKFVIEREVLLREGQPYRQEALDDTIRNLRVLPQISLVVVVPVVGSGPNRVGVVVITKDVWSLRPNWDFEISSGGLDELAAQPAEINVAGLHHTAYLNVDLLPKSLTLGAGYDIPRLGGTRVQLYSEGDVVINRDSGSAEGTYGQLTTGQTLFSSKTDWAWDASVVWADAILRRYENAQVGLYTSPTTGLSVPFEYREDSYQTAYEVQRSYGWKVKHDITIGAGISRAVYSTDLAGYNAQTVADFVAADVPVSDTRVGPWITYHTYEKRYLRVFDSETLALQEDYRLGHDVYVRVYPTPRFLGSSRDLVSIYGAAMYTWPVRDGMIRLAVQDLTDFGTDGIPDASLTLAGRITTPTLLGLGRIICDIYWLDRWRNFLNQQSFLGGDWRLRGYPTSFTSGSNVLSSNIEVRTRPIDIFTFHLAAAVFYDVGEAYTPQARQPNPFTGALSNFHPLQGVGVGLRGMLPLIDRVVYRFDVGFPMGEGRNLGVPPIAFFLTLGQAYGPPTTTVLGGQGITGDASAITGVTPVLPTGQGP